MGQGTVEFIKKESVLSFQVAQKLLDCFNEQANPAKMPHIGLNVYRIHALH